MSGLSEDDMALRKSNDGATQQDYIISCYITDFIQKAYQEYPDFKSKTIDEQNKILAGYADVKIAEINAKKKLQVQIQPPIN
jgi:hypothetical protein